MLIKSRDALTNIPQGQPAEFHFGPVSWECSAPNLGSTCSCELRAVAPNFPSLKKKTGNIDTVDGPAKSKSLVDRWYIDGI